MNELPFAVGYFFELEIKADFIQVVFYLFPLLPLHSHQIFQFMPSLTLLSSLENVNNGESKKNINHAIESILEN